MPRFYDLQQLSCCNNDADIEAALTDLDISNDPVARTEYLHKFMGTTQQFRFGGPTGGFSAEQEYSLAKAQLLAVNKW